jgi:hypothetical protein
MPDTFTLTETLWMPIAGQPTMVLSGSTVVVASAAAYHPRHKANVLLGSGALINGTLNAPGANYRTG